MVALMAVFGTVVYTIVSPPEYVPPTDTFAGLGQNKDKTVEVVQTPQTVLAKFNGRLELKTSALNAVDAFIKSAIDDNGLSASINPERRQGRRIYSLSCSREGLNSLLADLDNIWSELDSATLFVNTEDFGVQTVVDAVTIEQTTWFPLTRFAQE